MFALLTLPHGVPADAETRPALSAGRTDEPVGIIIRPGPAVARPRAQPVRRAGGRPGLNPINRRGSTGLMDWRAWGRAEMPGSFHSSVPP